jgi:hypothetical protein
MGANMKQPKIVAFRLNHNDVIVALDDEGQLWQRIVRNQSYVWQQIPGPVVDEPLRPSTPC